MALKSISLYDAIQNYAGSHARRKGTIVIQDTISDGIKKSCVLLEKAPLVSPGSAETSLLNNRSLEVQVRSRPTDASRYSVSGTGRLAFGQQEEDVRMIYRTTSSSKKAVSRSGEGDLTPLAFSSLSLSNITATSTNDTDSDCVTQNVNTPEVKYSKIDKHEAGSRGDGHRLGSSSSSIAVVAAASVTGSSTVKRKGTAPITGRKNPQVAVPGSVQQQQHQRGVGARETSMGVGVGTGGRAAAMAKMAALGEDWPEEEELPGMQLPMTQSLVGASGNGGRAGGAGSSTGGNGASTVGVLPSAAVRRDVTNAGQRQRKVKASKRNS